MTADARSGILRVNILGLANNATEKALLALIEDLNQTRTVYPGKASA